MVWVASGGCCGSARLGYAVGRPGDLGGWVPRFTRGSGQRVRKRAGVTKVFVVESGVARPRGIEVGRVQDGRQQVLSGLKHGEIVATLTSVFGDYRETPRF